MSRGHSHLIGMLVFTVLCAMLRVSHGENQHTDMLKEKRRGEQIFVGLESVNGKLAGHAEVLPVSASRCVNCHAQAAQPANSLPFAPALDRSSLREMHPRRGAPASAYDIDTFCRAIHDGIDPQYVMLQVSMPRFDIDVRQCRALWLYLTEQND